MFINLVHHCCRESHSLPPAFCFIAPGQKVKTIFCPSLQITLPVLKLYVKAAISFCPLYPGWCIYVSALGFIEIQNNLNLISFHTQCMLELHTVTFIKLVMYYMTCSQFFPLTFFC